MSIDEHIKYLAINERDDKFVSKVINAYKREVNNCVELIDSYNWDLDYTLECFQIEMIYRIELMRRRHCEL